MADTDTGRELAAKIEDLKELMAAYRGGILKEKIRVSRINQTSRRTE